MIGACMSKYNEFENRKQLQEFVNGMIHEPDQDSNRDKYIQDLSKLDLDYLTGCQNFIGRDLSP